MTFAIRFVSTMLEKISEQYMYWKYVLNITFSEDEGTRKVCKKVDLRD